MEAQDSAFQMAINLPYRLPPNVSGLFSPATTRQTGRPLMSYKPNSFVLPTNATEVCQQALEIQRNHASPLLQFTGYCDGSPGGHPAWGTRCSIIWKGRAQRVQTLHLSENSESPPERFKMQVDHRKPAKGHKLAWVANTHTIQCDHGQPTNCCQALEECH